MDLRSFPLSVKADSKQAELWDPQLLSQALPATPQHLPSSLQEMSGSVDLAKNTSIQERRLFYLLDVGVGFS